MTGVLDAVQKSDVAIHLRNVARMVRAINIELDKEMTGGAYIMEKTEKIRFLLDIIDFKCKQSLKEEDDDDTL